jgi:hypothetical protein
METMTMGAVPMRASRPLFWTTTGLLAAGMIAGGLGQLFRASWNVEGLLHLGYPLYVITVIACWKLAGIAVVLLPGLPLAKEWAYAGLFFLLTSAWVSHLAAGDGFLRALPPLVFAGLTAASWYLRPAERRLAGSAGRG